MGRRSPTAAPPARRLDMSTSCGSASTRRRAPRKAAAPGRRTAETARKTPCAPQLRRFARPWPWPARQAPPAKPPSPRQPPRGPETRQRATFSFSFSEPPNVGQSRLQVPAKPSQLQEHAQHPPTSQGTLLEDRADEVRPAQPIWPAHRRSRDRRRPPLPPRAPSSCRRRLRHPAGRPWTAALARRPALTPRRPDLLRRRATLRHSPHVPEQPPWPPCEPPARSGGTPQPGASGPAP